MSKEGRKGGKEMRKNAGRRSPEEGRVGWKTVGHSREFARALRHVEPLSAKIEKAAATEEG